MIRPATLHDGVFVAPLIVQALVPGAFRPAGSGNESEAYPVVEKFFREEINRHSYRNTLVYETGEGIVGSVVCYDGNDDERLGMPITLFLRNYYQDEEVAHFPEAEPGDFYIDTVSVRKDQQGKGIGKALIAAACARAKELGHRYIALLVDDANPGARRLYEQSGFKAIKKRRLWEHDYAYMRREL